MYILYIYCVCVCCLVSGVWGFGNERRKRDARRSGSAKGKRPGLGSMRSGRGEARNTRRKEAEQETKGWRGEK